MKYLVYKGTGGLTHFLRGLGTAIKYAKKHSRSLIIDTAQHEAFKLSFDEFFEITNPEVLYSCSYQGVPPDLKYHDFSIDELEKGAVELIRSKMQYQLADKHYTSKFPLTESDDDIVVYAGWWGDHQDINKYIKVRKEIMEKLSNYRVDGEYIGVHFRNTDTKRDLGTFVKKIEKKVEKSGIERIYLATDDETALEKFKTALPDLEFISFVNPYPYYHDGVKVKYSHEANPDKYQQIFDTLLDVYILISATRFINSKKSGLSQWIILMRQTEKNIFQI